MPIKSSQSVSILAATCALVAFGAPAVGQTPTVGAARPAPAAVDPMFERYERAAIFANDAKSRFALNFAVVPTWIGDDDRFWYCHDTEKGCVYTLVDAATGKSAPLFDHVRLAQKLSKLSGTTVSPDDLQLSNLKVLHDGNIVFNAGRKRYSFDGKNMLRESGDADMGSAVVSPDGKREIFIKGWNLWVRDLDTRKETQLTTDGEERYAYGVKPRQNIAPSPAEVQWAPDSRRILAVQTDERQVKDMPYIEYAREDDVRPRGFSAPYALPGDAHVPTYRLFILDTVTTKQTQIRHPGIASSRMLDTPINGGRTWWSKDGNAIFFVDIERGEKTARLMTAAAATGDTREVMRETNPKGYVELAENVYGPASIVPLPSRNEVVWYSERSGIAQLYQFDLSTGRQIRALTDDSYTVRSLLWADEKRGEIYVEVSGRVAGKNPYYRELMRISLDSGKSELLSAGDDDRAIWSRNNFLSFLHPGASGISPSGNYWVETRQVLDKPGTTVVRARDGRDVATVVRATLNGLPATYQLPEPALVKAADGQTILQAAIFRPSDFDPSRKYPVIDLIYGGPQAAIVPDNIAANFAPQAASLAELGFIVTMIDGRGTTGRNRAFREQSYGAAQTASNLEDHIAGIRQLAARYPYMDIDRVGITGFSGGGYMTVSAMTRFPDFFKVGVAASGNHDQRDFWHSWGERYQGMMEGDNYLSQANLTYVDKLSGPLMLYHGLMDTGVQPGTMFNLVQKLEDANKDFDLVLAPRAIHTYTGYGLRRAWDFFVRNLANGTPPRNFALQNSYDYEMAREKLRAKQAADAEKSK